MRNKKLKVSYNDVNPWFSVENDRIVKDTFQWAAIQSFIDKNNLTIELIDENLNWGSKNENGTFDGVIGRVNRILQ